MSKLKIAYSRKPVDCKIFQLTRILKVFMLAQLVHSKTRQAKNQESENVSDRELFSELLRKPVPPAVNQYCTSFCKRKQPYVSLRPKQRGSLEMERSLWTTQQSVCNSTIKLILSLGYRLAQSARERVGSALFCNTGTINSL